MHNDVLRFQDIRLSKHFVFLDFMHDRALYRGQTPLAPDALTSEHIEGGRALCQQLLEPLIERFGPCSIAAGWCPTNAGHHEHTPHVWTSAIAACDAVFHDWVNSDRAPIKLVEEIAKAEILFERIITYSGSEFMCLAWSAQSRHAIYENVRLDNGAKPRFVSHSRNKSQFARHPKAFTDRPNWRRDATGPRYRLKPHHLRVGRYFSLLDLARSEAAMEEGVTWEPSMRDERQLAYARLFAGILDPLVAQLGRVSVVKGMVPPRVLRSSEHDHLHSWKGSRAAVEFLLPLGAGFGDASGPLSHHQHVLDLSEAAHPAGGIKVRVVAELAP